MSEREALINRIFHSHQIDFDRLALDVYQHQYLNNDLYHAYCASISRTPDHVQHISEIPFLPIPFFKSHEVRCAAVKTDVIFESSGTTGSIPSRHFINDISIYEQSFLKGFERFYGQPQHYCIVGLLPSYLERQHSSLVYMVNHLIRLSENKDSGFYLYNYGSLNELLLKNEQNKQPTLLIGVSFALLDFSEQFPSQLKHTIVMETGGMKGRRTEMSKAELHQILKERLGTDQIHSEYGMTELCSQAYARSEGRFFCPPWMKVAIRAEDDPFDVTHPTSDLDGITGGLNIIDLANIESCSFIATEDFGRCYADQSFEVLGRISNSDMRGCSLMVI